MKNNQFVRLGGVLLLITSVVALLLGFFNDATDEIIAQTNLEKKIASMQRVMPEAETFTMVYPDLTEADMVTEVNAGSDASGTSVGWCFSMAPKGYGGAITMIVGISNDLTITGVEIVDHSETPGLGANAESESWLRQFAGQSGTLSVVKSAPQPGQIQAVTSATKTSNAVVKAVNQAMEVATALTEEGR